MQIGLGSPTGGFQPSQIIIRKTHTDIYDPSRTGSSEDWILDEREPKVKASKFAGTQ